MFICIRVIYIYVERDACTCTCIPIMYCLFCVMHFVLCNTCNTWLYGCIYVRTYVRMFSSTHGLLECSCEGMQNTLD